MHVKRIVLLRYIHEALKHRMAGILFKKKEDWNVLNLKIQNIKTPQQINIFKI